MMGDDRSRETLGNFLRFYRENKDLIATLSNTRTNDDIAEKTADIAQNKSEEQQESRPRGEVGNAAILEEYLKRFSA